VRVEIHETPPETFGEVVLEEELPSELHLKTPLIERILVLLDQYGLLDPREDWTVRLCLDELITNAIRHGNKSDASKTFRTTLFVSTTRWAIRVEDQGDGFVPDDVPDVENPETWLYTHGRGVLIISEYMDVVWYYHGGSRVQLTKHIQRNGAVE
jgi:serine/threonine-protein kinase RsbW